MHRICSILSEIISVVSMIILLAVVVLLVSGIRMDVVLSGSMEPEIMTGSVCLTNTRDRDPDIGDVVAYEINDIVVTHRIIGISEDGYITKGDNNDTEDIFPVRQEQIIGTPIGSIDRIGYMVMFLKSRRGATMLAVFVVAVMSIALLLCRKGELM